MASEQKADQLVPFSTRIKSSTKQQLIDYCNETNTNIGELVDRAIERLLQHSQELYKNAVKAKWEQINKQKTK